MLFRSKTSPKTWDGWIYWDRGTYYLYYLISEQYVCDGFGVATSTDGISWQDHGWALRHSEKMVRYFGSGSVWQNLDPFSGKRYLCNYSEWQVEGERDVQRIFFASSDDLLHWEKAGEDSSFHIDEKYYKRIELDAIHPWEDPRWDGICVIPKDEGGYHGYWTATPRDFLGFGYGTSPDGFHWQAETPPIIEWGDIPMNYFIEVGGVERIGDKYYAMLADYATVNCGMFGFVADEPGGPFRPSPKNYWLLQNKSRMHAWFSRFFRSPDGILVNHHTLAEGDFSTDHYVVYYAPIKRAMVIDSCLYLGWWEGNERLKAHSIPLSSSATELRFDPQQGILLEGSVDASSKLTIMHDRRATLISIYENSIVEIGSESLDGSRIECQERIDRQIDFGQHKSIILLLRHTMLELYINNILIQCYTMDTPASGSLAWHRVKDIRLWYWGNSSAA